MPEPTSANQPAATPELTGFAKDVGGNWDLAAQRFHDATQHARAAQEESRRFQAELERTQALIAAQSRPQEPAYLATVAEQLGVQPNMLAGALAEIAAPMVRSAIAPIQDTLQARQRLATELPDFIKNENEVFAWAATQPQLLNEITQAMRIPGMAALATRTLYREWQAANPPKTPSTGAPPAAQIPPLGGGGTPVQQQASGMSEEESKQFLARLQHAVRTHDPRPVAADLFKGINWAAPPGMITG